MAEHFAIALVAKDFMVVDTGNPDFLGTALAANIFISGHGVFSLYMKDDSLFALLPA
ncbi:hypothetical protein [Dethiosulfatarculus sandiegensis]|uniref:hypothetical protein n=1 Tax=Dethiosulfatarculus sandiegensis TaxID=1429043 RepID=UPI0012E27229|nr:hypothetical protein [Dethiosulfatarculus sandiegensis]